MQLGVVFPQAEIGAEPGGVRDYALAAEAAGYDHLLVYDHVLGASPDRPGGFRGPYTHETMFHEPLVLFGYLAAVTQRIELVTGILILPQRQTALVAKQAAEVDVLSGGRLRLGVGVGWNAVEYRGLGKRFGDRGRRIESQVALLRALWAEPVISVEADGERIELAGINPRPGRPIPIWMGGMADPVLDRIGRLADGWFPQYRHPEELAPGVDRIRRAARAAGRQPNAVGVEARVGLAGRSPEECAALAHEWEAAGATHVGVNTMGAGLRGASEHIAAIESVRRAWDAAR